MSGSAAYRDWIDRHYICAADCYGKCHQAARIMQEAFPELRIVVGYVTAGSWGERDHAWLVAPDGSIVDPTAQQFQQGVSDYQEWKPGDPVNVGPCANCGEDIWIRARKLEDVTHPTVCGDACAALMIDRNLIVPYCKHTLAECSEIIRQAINPQGHEWKAAPKLDDQTLWRSWIDACLTEATKPLSKWEQDFVQSISDDLTFTGRLSDRQVEVLERIYTEKV